VPNIAFNPRRAESVPLDCPVELPAPPGAAESKLVIARAAKALMSEGRLLTTAELAELAVVPDDLIGDLGDLAHAVRLQKSGSTVEVEGILSAKTGGCPEDCHFCSQSAHFDSPVRPVPFLGTDEVLAAARETAALGASEFCVVLAVRGPDERTMRRLEQLVPLVRDEVGVRVAVSAGILEPEQASRLAAAGVHRYNHNLETSRSYFPAVVTTHTYDERFQTCTLVGEAGMELCCGALIGLCPGEVPLNFLNPRPGTPFANYPILSAVEAIRWIAMFRLALPDAILRLGGGREVTLGALQSVGLTSGVNALIVGNYLTTLGRDAKEDIAMLAELEMPIGVLGDVL
jgi:biotin synthase